MRLFQIIVMCIVLYMAGAWIGNVVKLVKCDFEAPYKEEVIYGMGVLFAPLSAVTVWYEN